MKTPSKMKSTSKKEGNLKNEANIKNDTNLKYKDDKNTPSLPMTIIPVFSDDLSPCQPHQN